MIQLGLITLLVALWGRCEMLLSAAQLVLQIITAGIAGLALLKASKAYEKQDASYEQARKVAYASHHRPRLRVRGVGVDQRQTGELEGILDVVNSGASSATVTKSGCWIYYGASLPRHPIDPEPNHFAPLGTRIGQGDRKAFPISDLDPRSPSTAVGSTFVCGFISFQDEEGIVRHLDFCQVRPDGAQRFKCANDDDYVFTP